jgi:TatD DNase family protein
VVNLEAKDLYIDAHTHSPARRENALRIYNLSPDEWPEAASFAPFCAGIHPLELTTSINPARLKELETLLKTPGAAALGECGLDRLANAPLELQTELFLKQAEIAARLDLPVVVHCVRAFPELIAARKLSEGGKPWIVHGYRGNAQTALELARHGFMLSFGEALLLPQQPLHDALNAIPLDAILLETDESTRPLQRIQVETAKLLGISPEELGLALRKNFERAFGIKA